MDFAYLEIWSTWVTPILGKGLFSSDKRNYDEIRDIFTRDYTSKSRPTIAVTLGDCDSVAWIIKASPFRGNKPMAEGQVLFMRREGQGTNLSWKQTLLGMVPTDITTRRRRQESSPPPVERIGPAKRKVEDADDAEWSPDPDPDTIWNPSS